MPLGYASSAKKFDFEALRNPLISDLPDLSKARIDDVSGRTTLGSFSDILQRSSLRTCSLCRLFGDSLTRPVAHRPGDQDDCSAQVHIFGAYDDLRGKWRFINRLSIHTNTGKSSLGVLGKNLFFAFHACNIGAASVQVDERFTDPRPGADMMVFGGRRRPFLLDLRWVRSWIDICKADHGVAYEWADINSNERLKMIRFIDVEQMCVVTLEDVNLSGHRYRLGGPQELKLERHNKEDLARPGALATKSLPQAIAVSILLAKWLGFRNLWIDALCIIQDDDDVDKMTQVAATSQIYGFAFLTIVLRPGQVSTAACLDSALEAAPSRKKK